MAVLPASSAKAELPVGAGALYLTDRIINDATSGVGNRIHELTDVPATAAADGRAYQAMGFGGATYSDTFEYTFTQDTVLSGDLVANVWFSCNVPTLLNGDPVQAQSRFVLQKGTTTISQVDGRAAAGACTGSSNIFERTYVVDTKDTEFAAGEKIRAQFLIWAVNTPHQAGQLYYLVGGAAHPSAVWAVGLPGGGPVAPLSQVISDIVEGETAQVSQSFTNSTSDTYRFNWTTNLTEAQVEHNVTTTNGSAQLRVLDGAQAEVLNVTINATGSGVSVVANATAGNWTLEIAYSAFVGSLNLTAGAVPVPEATPEATNVTTPSNSTEAPASPAEVDDGAAGIPSVGLLGAVIASFAVVVRRRRRA